MAITVVSLASWVNVGQMCLRQLAKVKTTFNNNIELLHAMHVCHVSSQVTLLLVSQGTRNCYLGQWAKVTSIISYVNVTLATRV